MFKRFLLFLSFILVSNFVYAGDFNVYKLQNGQILIVQEVKSNPIVTIDTWVKTGSINETDKNNGVSHFLEHLFFKGTALHPAGDIDRILESKGAVVNAATSKDFTHYYVTLPSEYFDTALELHSDMLMNPQLPRKELESERKVVLEEISKDCDTPSRKVYENLNTLMYSTHPYKRKVIGTSDIISTISREEILDYYNKFYAPSNMVTVVVGDVSAEKVLQKVSKSFNAEYKKPLKKSFRHERPLSQQKRNIEYTDSNIGYMMIGFRSVPINDDDTYALDVLAQILGGSNSARLYQNIKEQKGLVYSISASNGSFRDDGILYINAGFKPNNYEKIEKNIFDEILNLQKYGVTEEELSTAKSMIDSDTKYARESTSNIASELGYIATLSGSTDIYKNYLANIEKVSAKEVQAAAQKYLGINKSAVSLVLPKYMENCSQKPSTDMHTAKKISEKSGSEKYISDNGSTLIINKHNNNDIVAISIIAKGGEFLENKIGEGTLMSGLLLKGTSKYSAQELTKLMEDNGIKISPLCSEDIFIIDVQTTSSKMDLTMDLLNEIINNAALDDYELEKKRTEIMGRIKQKRDLPMNIALENFKTHIYENSVYSHSNKVIEKSLPSLTRADVASYYSKIFDSKNIVVSVNGNVDKDKMIQGVGEIFKDKKQPVFKYSDYKVTKLNSPKKITETLKNSQTAWLFIGWQTEGYASKKDFVTLKVIDTLLGGGMSSRIFVNLREQDGLAYQLGSNYNAKNLGGSFVIFVGTNTSSLNYSRDKLMKEMERIKTEFVSDKELQDAKDRLKGSFIVALEKNSEKASVTGRFEANGFGYDFLDTYIKMIDDVSSSDIMKVSNKYFNNIYLESSIK